MGCDDQAIVFEENHSTRHRMCAHLLWMIRRIEREYNHGSIEDIEKSASWMGWILSKMEVMGLITNDESQEWIRMDQANRKI